MTQCHQEFSYNKNKEYVKCKALKLIQTGDGTPQTQSVVLRVASSDRTDRCQCLYCVTVRLSQMHASHPHLRHFST